MAITHMMITLILKLDRSIQSQINIKPISKIEDQNKINFTQIANINNNNSTKALNFLKQNSIKKY